MTIPALLLAALLAGAAAQAQEPPAWSLAPEAAAARCEAAARRDRETALHGVASLSEAARTFANTPEALETALQDVEDAAASVVLLKYVAVSSAAREAGAGCEARLDALDESAWSRKEIQKAVFAYADRREPLSNEGRALLERQLAEFLLRGAGLAAEPRMELRLVRERRDGRERFFSDNLEWPRPTLLLSEAELAGLPAPMLASLPVERGLRRVIAAPRDYPLLMAALQDESARRRLEFLFHSRPSSANGPVLREILELRAREAALLGRRSYAELGLSRRLNAGPFQVRSALQGLARRLQAPAREELAVLLDLRSHTATDRNRSLPAWDRPYYLARLRAARYPGTAAASAPIEESSALKALERLLGLSIRRVPSAELWHPDAGLYAVSDAHSAEPLGRLYLDLRARPGKTPGWAVLRLRRHEAAVLASLPGAGMRLSPENDWEALFHSLGHACQILLSRPRYGRFSGENASPDLMEAQALLLGRLAWQPEAAPAFPPRLLDECAGARRTGRALEALEETAFALWGLEAHSPAGAADPGAGLSRLLKKTALLPPTPGTHPEDAALSLVREPLGGSDRLLSLLAAEELWGRLREDGLFSPVAGQHLRETLFAAGAVDEPRTLANYLGRKPTLSAVPDLAAWPPPVWGDEGWNPGPETRRRVLR